MARLVSADLQARITAICVYVVYTLDLFSRATMRRVVPCVGGARAGLVDFEHDTAR